MQARVSERDRVGIRYPSPASRMIRELERSELKAGSQLGVSEFLALLARRMPYLDRGRLFNQACQRISHAPNGARLSPLLSSALRELHDDETIRLVPSGDAAERVRLTEDAAHPIDTFTNVIFFPGRTA